MAQGAGGAHTPRCRGAGHLAPLTQPRAGGAQAVVRSGTLGIEPVDHGVGRSIDHGPGGLDLLEQRAQLLRGERGEVERGQLGGGLRGSIR